MIPDDLEALALADAIGALDAEDRLALEARVATLAPKIRENHRDRVSRCLMSRSSCMSIALKLFDRARMLAIEAITPSFNNSGTRKVSIRAEAIIIKGLRFLIVKP